MKTSMQDSYLYYNLVYDQLIRRHFHLIKIINKNVDLITFIDRTEKIKSLRQRVYIKIYVDSFCKMLKLLKENKDENSKNLLREIRKQERIYQEAKSKLSKEANKIVQKVFKN